MTSLTHGFGAERRGRPLRLGNPLMELLGKQERYQEALDYYGQLEAALTEQGLTRAGYRREPDPRTRDLADYLRTKQTQRGQFSTRVIESSNAFSTLRFLSDNPQHYVFSHATTLHTLHAEERAGRSLASLRQHLVKQALDANETSVLTPPDEFLPGVVGRFSQMSTRSFRVDETTPEALEHFTTLVHLCRQMSEGNELKAAESILWASLPQVENIAKHSFAHQHTAAHIASQGYLLAASLAGHRNDLQARHFLSEQALLYGKLAQDHNLQIAAFRQLSITFDYLERPDTVCYRSTSTFFPRFTKRLPCYGPVSTRGFQEHTLS